MDPIAVLIQLVVILLLFALIWYVIEKVFPVDQRIKTIILAIVAIIAVLYLLRLVGWWV